MATTASSRVSSSAPSRRTPTSSPPPAAPIARGATARSAVPPRVSSSAVSRRSSLKAPAPIPANGETRESLSVSLKQETDQKEQVCRVS